MKKLLFTCLMLMSLNALAVSGSYLCKFDRYEVDLDVSFVLDRGTPINLETYIAIADTDYDMNDPSRTVAIGESTSSDSTWEETIVFDFGNGIYHKTFLIFKNFLLTNLATPMGVKIQTEINGKKINTFMVCQKRVSF